MRSSSIELVAREVDLTLMEREPHPALVERARHRDPQAWAEIYERFSRQIYSFFLHAVRDRRAAEDLSAGVFLEALEAVDRFSGAPRAMRVWLFQIGRRSLIDYFRSDGRAQVVPIEDADSGEIVAFDPADDPELAALTALVRQNLLLAVHAPSKDQKEVVLLRLVGELTSAEITNIVGKSVGAVKALQYRAMTALGKALTRDIGPWFLPGRSGPYPSPRPRRIP
jgi:RNA polymerase sigma-70 factor (ECF subfamily)